MANYYTHFTVRFPVGSADNVTPALNLYEQLAEELEENDETIGFLAEAETLPPAPISGCARTRAETPSTSSLSRCAAPRRSA